MGAKNRGGCRRAHGGTLLENTYANRRRRQQADSASLRQQRRFRSPGSVTYLACPITFIRVMHRTRLSGRDRAVTLVMTAGRRADGLQRKRRGRHRELARQPAGNHPRELASDENHGLLLRYHDRFTARIANFLAGARGPGLIQIAVLTALLAFAASSASARPDQAAPEPHRHADAAAAAEPGRGPPTPTSSSATTISSGSSPISPRGNRRTGSCSAATAVGRRTADASRACCRSSRSRSKAQGSPQLFQTGESYQRTPLVNYQHPHDLLMGLGATYRLERPRVRYVFGADLVGSPTLGPTPFMHRESARNNPQVPLSHHCLDSTHITTGRPPSGVEIGPLTFEASVFRGDEPDENRLNIEQPRARFLGRPRRLAPRTVAGAVLRRRLHEPEWFEPYDVTRLTASIGFNGASRRVPCRHARLGTEPRVQRFDNTDDATCSSGTFAPPARRRSTAAPKIGQADLRARLPSEGLRPSALLFPYHRADRSARFAIFRSPACGRIGVGADVTWYPVMSDVLDLYEGSRSFHVFLRWRPSRRQATSTDRAGGR